MYLLFACLHSGMRERNGYALANLRDDIKPDCHYPSKIRRDYDKREHIVEILDQLLTEKDESLNQLPHILKLLEKIANGIINKLKNNRSGELKKKFWIARYRLTWIISRIEQGLLELYINNDDETSYGKNNNVRLRGQINL